MYILEDIYFMTEEARWRSRRYASNPNVDKVNFKALIPATEAVVMGAMCLHILNFNRGI